MTAQMNDVFRYRDREYALAGISEGELIDPASLGLTPASPCTACWRGFQAIYGLAGDRLVLDALHVNLLEPEGDYVRQPGPPINGVEPSETRRQPVQLDFFNNHYEAIGLFLDYSGGLLLAEGFIRDLYVHMGFHPAWKYEHVVELTFDHGHLTGEYDRSKLMAEARQRFLTQRSTLPTDRLPTENEIANFVERAFDRRYG